MQSGWESVAYRNLNGGIVAVHRATKPEATITPTAAGSQTRGRRRSSRAAS
jgi:demethylmenaquinone methyltransferase/2-methoxy-6-polyprenyl-1,4-benzoquinol methylase